MTKQEIAKRKATILTAETLGLTILMTAGLHMGREIDRERYDTFEKLVYVEAYAPENVQNELEELFEIHAKNYNNRLATLLGIEVASLASVGLVAWHSLNNIDKMQEEEEEKEKKLTLSL